MAELLKGAPVAAKILEKAKADVIELKNANKEVSVAIVRIGEKPDDLSYEKSIRKKCDEVGITVTTVILETSVTEEEYISVVKELNADDKVSGVLLFRPLPKTINDEKVRNTLDPKKDIDGITDISLAGVFTNTKKGFAPCTAKAVIEILDFYNIDIDGARATVLGRSLVVGRPVAMLLMHRNATVTIAHSATVSPDQEGFRSKILVAATGKPLSVNEDYFNGNQYVIDVGMSFDTNLNKLVGDCVMEDAEVVNAITPVPGGVGVVTTAVLISHIVEAAKRGM